MTLSIGSALADAAALWRSDRDLVLRIAGVFYLLPILALAMLASGLAVPEAATPEQMRAIITAFYSANLVWLLLITVALDLGTLALLNLFLQRGLSVRELLQASALRLLPFVLLGFANGALMQLGFALFVIPGLYIFGRTWLMGPAYAAEPERGLLGAIERGFKSSAGNGWRIAILGMGVVIITGAAALALLILVQMLTALAGGGQLAQAILLVPVAAGAALAYAAFTLVRVAAYRRLAGSSSGT
ncbi:hypothetical protein [Sphingomonas sp. LT1P40]|uniref:hypothetical protein n=1 Tax=Alteristakelama amylovorans TaxID=3096166 RepID=UPI002FC776BF